MIGLRFPLRPQQDKEESRTATKPIHNKVHLNDDTILGLVTPDSRLSHLVGTGTSVRAPNMTACCRRTNATKGFSRKSTSPTRTFEASASRGSFFMNLFFSCPDRENKASTSNPNSAWSYESPPLAPLRNHQSRKLHQNVQMP